MKRKIISKLFILSFISGSIFLLSSCSASDEETVIVPKTVEQYRQQMKQFVDAELLTVRNCVVGYNKGDFKSTTNFDAYKSAYLTVLIADSAVIVKPDVTIAELVNANKTLAVPGKAFTGSLWISDRRPLNDSIVSSEALNTATLVGTLVGQVSQEAKTNFTTAITNAKAVRGSSYTIERQVLEAIVKLEEAETVFKAAIIK